MTRNVLSNELQTAKPARSGLQSKQFTGLLLIDISKMVFSALGPFDELSFGLKLQLMKSELDLVFQNRTE